MIRAALLVSLALPALGACAKEEGLRVEDAYVRYAPVRDNPSAAYFTIRGGAQDVTLIGVTSDVAIRSEMHETMAGNQGMASMRPVTSVQVPAGSEVRFEPGGKHVMLWKINPGVAPPKRIALQLSFSNGERLRVDAPLVAAGDPAPERK